MHRLHPATILLEGLGFVRHFGWSLILVFFARPKGEGSMANLFFTIMFGGVGFLAVLYAIFRYLTMTYTIENGSFIVRKGMIWKQVRTIPLERIQNVNLKRTLLHRLFKVTTLDIETASGSGTEASLAVLSQDVADHLRHQLLGSVALEFQVAETVEAVHYRATLKDLVIAGAFQNRLIYIIATVAGLFQFDEVIVDGLKNSQWIERAISAMPRNFGIGVFAILGFVGLILGWLASIIATTVKYYGFTVWPHARGLRIRYGILTQVENVVPVGRIQSVSLGQPMLYRPFGLFEVMVQSAGSFGDKEHAGSAKLAPIVGRNEVDRIVKLAFANLSVDRFPFKLVSQKSVWRSIIASVWTLAFLEGFFFFARTVVPTSVPLPFAASWIGGIVFMALSTLMAVKRYKTTGYAVADGFLASRQGVFRRDLVAAPLERTQIVELHQGFLQKRWGLADVKLITASGVVVVSDVELAEALEIEKAIIAGAGTGFGIGGV